MTAETLEEHRFRVSQPGFYWFEGNEVRDRPPGNTRAEVSGQCGWDGDKRRLAKNHRRDLSTRLMTRAEQRRRGSTRYELLHMRLEARLSWLVFPQWARGAPRPSCLSRMAWV
jgi:hypothetical protein